MSAVVSGLVTALLSILTKLLTQTLAEDVMRRVLVHLLEWAVKSTSTSVDDEIIAPVIAALNKPESQNAPPA